MENSEYKLLVVLGLVLAALGYVLLFAGPVWTGIATFLAGSVIGLAGAIGAIWNS